MMLNEKQFKKDFGSKKTARNVPIEEITGYSFAQAIFFKGIKKDHFENVEPRHLASLIAVTIDQVLNENVFNLNGLEKDLEHQDISLN